MVGEKVVHVPSFKEGSGQEERVAQADARQILCGQILRHMGDGMECTRCGECLKVIGDELDLMNSLARLLADCENFDQIPQPIG